MTPENSVPPRSRPERRALAGAVCLALYALAVFGLRVLAYRFHWNELIAVPLVAELVLIKSVWSTASVWKGLLGRLVGVVAGNTLTYTCYIVPVLYRHQEPWPEEVLWLYVSTGIQSAVAAVCFFAVRVFRRARRR